MSESLFLRRMKVMCVEDDDTAREALVSVLKRRASRVIEASDGMAGLEEYRKHKPDIVLVDMLMPNMSGTELIENIRREYADEKLSVIVISALGDSNTIINAVDAGIDKYIMKPVDVDVLLKALEEQAELLYHRKYNTGNGGEDNPREKEDEIKREIAAFLKKTTGKGPKNTSVSIGSGNIEFVATEIMTIMERTIFERSGNFGIIKYMREIFFFSLEAEFCKMLESVTGRRYRLDRVTVDAQKDKIKVVFNELSS